MRNGKIYEQATWVLRINGKEFGLLPTPTASDCCNRKVLKGHEKGLFQMRLSIYIKMKEQEKFPTPQARDGTRNTSPKKDRLPDYVNSNKHTGELNPAWVDWLMGYPLKWTDLKDLEIQLYLK